MKKTIFTGSGVAIITPFTETGVDYESLGFLLDFQIENSTDAIIICGTTGESATMPTEEHLEVIKYTIEKVNGRVPVIAGTGSNDTEHAIYMTKVAENYGADAILTVTPYYNKSTQRGLIQHFGSIAKSTKLPIILYNVPSRTGINMLPETVAEIAKFDNIVGIKEASGSMSQLLKIAKLCPDLDIYSGEDDITVPAMMMGAQGVISVLANVAPQQTHDMTMKVLDGDFKGAAKMQLEALDLIDALFCEVNPIPVKTALGLMGWRTGKLRLPLYEMAPENVEKLKNALINYGIKLK